MIAEKSLLITAGPKIFGPTMGGKLFLWPPEVAKSEASAHCNSVNEIASPVIEK